MKDQIDRLGFSSWADNLIVDFIENHKPIMTMGYGTLSVEKADGTTVRAVFADNKADFIVRGYTGSGWEVHERTVKL
jgi:hypothetical protein